MQTYTADSQIGDSTGCATALMCGVKANVNTVGLDKSAKFEDCFESFNAQVPSLVDWAQKHGKDTSAPKFKFRKIVSFFYSLQYAYRAVNKEL